MISSAKNNAIEETYIIQYYDGIPFKLKSAFDFSFLKAYGTIFKIFDEQDSGNICFGIQKNDSRYFIKFAGTRTVRYNGEPADAICGLKATLPIYDDLKHENLVDLIEAKEIGGGFATVFKWVDGDCMGRQFPESHQSFMQLPVSVRLAAFGEILSFFEHVAIQNYVAIDFYDGSIMYNYENNKTVICDIDLFGKKPYKNEMGRMWGSSRFLSPEEYQFGALIDEVTNVYTLGATAFAFFGDYQRNRDTWQLGNRLFEIATNAVSNDRSQRYQSVTQLKEAWLSELSLDK